MRLALAYTCKSLEQDPTSVDELFVLCAGCDPDNPKSVPRAKCPICRGSGKTHPAISVIVGELKASKIALLQGGKNRRNAYDE
jgi:hypothetical protein